MRPHIPTIALASLALGAIAYAGEVARLPQTAHKVSVTSVGQSGGRMGARMHVRVDEAQPGSKVAIFRQRRSA